MNGFVTCLLLFFEHKVDVDKKAVWSFVYVDLIVFSIFKVKYFNFFVSSSIIIESKVKFKFQSKDSENDFSLKNMEFYSLTTARNDELIKCEEKLVQKKFL